MKRLFPSANLSIGQCASVACVLEVSAPKVGNVHPGADFEDLTYAHFVASAVAIGPAMEAAASQPLGRTVLDAIRATRQVVQTNTNLGTVLLLAPLAAVARHERLATGLGKVLANLNADDARDVYAAIRWAHPGGLGHSERFDVFGSPPPNLLEAMATAAQYDLVARQYVNGFREVFDQAAPWLAEGIEAGWSLADTIVHAHLRLIAACGDSLIMRKCGAELSRQAARRAAEVLAAGPPGHPTYMGLLAEFDRWLRADGHRRNPGTTADLLAAGLFTLLRG